MLANEHLPRKRKPTATSGHFSVAFWKRRKSCPRVTMATYSLANERLRALEDIEREIGAILQNAGSRYDDRRGSGSENNCVHMRRPETGSRVGRDPKRARCEQE